MLDYFLSSASFLPHGFCLLWRPDLVALHVASDITTGLAYFSIPLAILRLLILLCHRLLRNAIFPKKINSLATCAQKY